jgi:cytoskeletal protein CcmA (bactofilin family)
MWEKLRAQNEALKGMALIGRDMLIRGSVQSDQDIYIDGSVEGSLEVPNCRLTIGPHGKADSGARAREVDLQGVIDGDVESTETISIRSGARLVGNVRTAGIIIEDGAYFKGSIDIVNRREPEVVAEVTGADKG